MHRKLIVICKKRGNGEGICNIFLQLVNDYIQRSYAMMNLTNAVKTQSHYHWHFDLVLRLFAWVKRINLYLVAQWLSTSCQASSTNITFQLWLSLRSWNCIPGLNSIPLAYPTTVIHGIPEYLQHVLYKKLNKVTCPNSLRSHNCNITGKTWLCVGICDCVGNFILQAGWA